MPDGRYRVVVDVFSGRPNPEWTVSGRQAEEIGERVSAAPLSEARLGGAVKARLGYRGVMLLGEEEGGSAFLRLASGVIESAVGPDLMDTGSEIERWLLDTAPESIQADPAWPVVRAGAMNSKNGLDEFVRNARTRRQCPPCRSGLATPFNPGKWNNPSVQPRNNSYNYANDIITNTYAQPGRRSGSSIPPLDCSGLNAAARRDRLVPVTNIDVPVPYACYVALVIWPGVDYHWYRQDHDGCWSHKPGGAPATNLDNAGLTIATPASCNRGPYAIFCGYMATNPTSVTIA
jgi:hypothetical protein